MGWASGSILATELVEIIKEHVEDAEIKYHLYEALITSFSDADCDTLNEVIGIDSIFDLAFKDSPYFDDDEEFDEDPDQE